MPTGVYVRTPGFCGGHGSGSQNPMYGRHHSDVTKARMSAKKKGKRPYVMTDEVRAHMSKAQRAIPLSLKKLTHIRALGRRNRGRQSPRKGVTLTAATKQLISKGLSGRFRGTNSPHWKGGTWIADGRRRRRAKLANAPGSHTDQQWQMLKVQYSYTCPACMQVEPYIHLTEDHIVPLSRGGSDNIDNIQPLCGPCNSSKGTKSIKYEFSIQYN